MKKLIEIIIGDKKTFDKTYAKLYGKQDYTSEIQSIRRGLLKKYVCLAIAVCLIIPAVIIHEKVSRTSQFEVSSEREISIARPEADENALRIPMKLEVLTDENERIVRDVVILVRPREEYQGYESEFSIEDIEFDDEELIIDLDDEIKKLLNAINNSSYDEKLVLPMQIADGIQITWEETHSSRIPLLIMLFIVAGIALYQGRFSRIKAIEKEARESIIRELPEFINKLVLLLSAGLVLSSAFEKILESYENRGREVKSYFYSQLLQISRGMRETNDSMIGGLKDFSGRSGVREFTRITSIIADNASKGAELAEKLQAESELLWLTKKKLAEEKGKLAETKMTLPLMILLLTLIMVTIAPALMEM